MNKQTNYKNLNLDRTYVLAYVYNLDFVNQKTIAFLGQEIKEALDMLYEPLLQGEYARELKKTLRTDIIISGRLLLDKPLLKEHPFPAINMMQRANDGCESAQKLMRLGFAMYLGLNIDEIASGDSEMRELGVNMDESVLFVFDQDFREDIRIGGLIADQYVFESFYSDPT